MRTRPFIAVVVVLVVLVGGAGTVYAFDHSERNTIAHGVRVAGVDVGGLTAAGARARIERLYVASLRRPITVRRSSRTFVLSARESRVGADVGGMVEEALAAGRGGSILARTWRRVTGERLHVDIAARATYSEAAVLRLVDRVRAATDRPAKDADISFTAGGIGTVRSHDGLAVLAHALHQRVARAVVDPHAERTISARTRRVAPKVSTAQLAQRYATVLIVNRGAFRLQLYQRLTLVKSYPIAVGQIGLETPAGLYHIQNKTVNPAWTKPNSDWVKPAERGDVVPGGAPDNPLKARWLGIFAGAGIHGIDPSEYGSIGHAASHGCVRMRIPDVEDLYPRVPVGAPIYIA